MFFADGDENDNDENDNDENNEKHSQKQAKSPILLVRLNSFAFLGDPANLTFDFTLLTFDLVLSILHITVNLTHLTFGEVLPITPITFDQWHNCDIANSFVSVDEDFDLYFII